MITLITGLPGASKTLYALNFVKAKAEKENRPVFYFGVKECTLPWQEMQSGEDWVNCPDGAIILIDEAQKVFRPRGNGSAVPKHVEALETHRHRGIDLFIVTQHPMLVDTNLRRLTGQHMHVVRAFGLHKSTVHEWPEVHVECEKRREGSIRHDFVFPKESFNWYKSAEIHTHKRNIPFRLIFLLASPLLLAGVIYLAYSLFTSNLDKSKKTPSAPLPGASFVNAPAPSASVRQPHAKDDNDWLADQRARIVGLPHTAPVYDKLQSVSTMPTPSACVASTSKCECYTDQGTRLAAVQDVICRDIVKNGWFDPYAKNKPHQEPGNKGDGQSGMAKL